MKKLGSFGALILLFLFLCSAIMLVILEVVTYEHITQSSLEQVDIRSPIQYLTERIRSFDCKEGIEVKKVQGVDALVFTEVEGENTYETWLYGYNGSLCEMSRCKTDTFKLEDGKVIAKVNNLSIKTVQPNLIKVKLKDHAGREHTYAVLVRSNLKAV